MANEITLTAALQASKNSVKVVNSTTAKIQNMETVKTHMTHEIQNVGTSEEALDVGDVDITNATGGEYMVLLFNRDATNYVSVEVKYAATPSYWVIGIMRPGEPWGPVRLPKLDGSSLGGIYLKANTAACDVEIVVVEGGNPAA